MGRAVTYGYAVKKEIFSNRHLIVILLVRIYAHKLRLQNFVCVIAWRLFEYHFVAS